MMEDDLKDDDYLEDCTCRSCVAWRVLTAGRDRYKAALVGATAELIYLRLYGKDGAVWRANESKDVWRLKALEALAPTDTKGE